MIEVTLVTHAYPSTKHGSNSVIKSGLIFLFTVQNRKDHLKMSVKKIKHIDVIKY